MTDVRARLARARLYVCTDARTAQGDLRAMVATMLAAGVDIVQLRDKSLTARQELAALEVVAEECARHDALWAVNDRVDIAAAAAAPIVHLGQDDLPAAHARRLLGPEVVIGRSTHSLEQALAAAEDPDVDYFAVGPLWATPTKPGRPAVGLSLAADVASHPLMRRPDATPWFAIGGIDSGNIAQVAEVGAPRVVVVRAVTDAADPGEAVRRLRAGLTAAPGGHGGRQAASALAADAFPDAVSDEDPGAVQSATVLP